MHVLRVSGDLPLIGGSLTMREGHRSATDLLSIRAVTFDFGNTLVPVDRAGLDAVVRATVAWLASVTGRDTSDLAEIWEEERDRQWRKDVPSFRETDLAARIVRVLARARGMAAPATAMPWNDRAAAALSEPSEIARALAVYSGAFSDLPPDPDARLVLETLVERGLRVAILSNWPLAASIDHYVEIKGWAPLLSAIVVSERVGTIKPRPQIFRAAEAALGAHPHELLHVGDDWAADVVGARDAGWHAGYLRARPHDSPLPGSEPSGEVSADLQIERLRDILPALPDGPGPRAGQDTLDAGERRVTLRTQ
jgi:HAD superfamily hydrolase (TIGR01549 family)